MQTLVALVSLFFISVGAFFSHIPVWWRAVDDALTIAPTATSSASSTIFSNAMKNIRSTSTLERVAEGKKLLETVSSSLHTFARPTEPLTIAAIIGETNAQRYLQGLPLYTENTTLDTMAEMKLRDMVALQYFDHVSPTGTTIEDLAKTAGYAYLSVGENLAFGDFTGNKDIVQAWMNSPGHRANLLNTHFTEIGVAAERVTLNGESGWLSVQEFGLPQSACPAPDTKEKTAAQALSRQLDELSAELEKRRTALGGMSPRSDAYGDAVQAYNALAASYDTILQRYKAAISDYNTQVDRFNTCMKQKVGDTAGH